MKLTALKSALKNLLKEQDFFFFFYRVPSYLFNYFLCPGFLAFLGNLYSKGCCLNFLVTMPVSEKKNTFCIFLCSLIVLKHISSLAIKLFSCKRGCEASACLNQRWLLTSNSRNARSALQKGGGSKVCSGIWASISLAVSEYKRKQMT